VSVKYPLYIGIDGGASGSRGRLVESDGHILVDVDGGPANPRFGLEATTDAIVALVEAALDKAGLSTTRLTQVKVGLGLAGVGQLLQQQQMLNWRHPFGGLALATDAHVACLGAHQGPNGGVVVVGTGSCGLALPRNLPRQIGGWGFPISDCGSGAWIGLQAIRHALEALDGLAPRGPLDEALLPEFEADAEQFVGWLDAATPRDYAAFAPRVFDQAETDPTAAAILAEAGVAIGTLIDAVADQPVEAVYLLGGLAEPLHPYLPKAAVERLAEPKGDAMDGALTLIRRVTSSVSLH
jgi:glucosamine kinase